MQRSRTTSGRLEPRRWEAGARAHRRRAGDRSRTGELLGGLTGVAVAVATLSVLLPLARAPRPPGATPRVDDVLLTALAWVGAGLSCWLAVGSALVVASLLPGTAGRAAEDLAARVTPLVVRRALTLVLSASVGSVVLPAAPVSGLGAVVPTTTRASAGHEGSPPAPRPGPDPGFTPTTTPTPSPAPSAAPSPTRPPTRPATVVTVAPSAHPAPTVGPGFVPTRPLRTHDGDRSRLLAPTPRATVAVHDLVTVRRGDTLWSIAAHHLGSGATPTSTAREWPRWYAANREVIGDDPDLLLPGQQLRPPEPDRGG
ncbi:hypothetical protein GCM10023258_22290 [Terrabacter aeriphilus]|uniref:LysM domain-containing protein n=1 Tax=Terrabacter aeriphilus TaxID=515662 RepID=A0ABP9JC76_9MICO